MELSVGVWEMLRWGSLGSDSNQKDSNETKCIREERGWCSIE